MLFSPKISVVQLMAAMTLCVSLCSVPALALELSPQIGKIEKSLTGWNGKTIYLIQEAHVQLESQQAISEILKNLVDQQMIQLILVEGGWGDVRLSPLRLGVKPEKIQDVADEFLRNGEISAEEFLNLTEYPDLILWGIEDANVYRQNMKAFIDLQEQKQQGEEALRILDEKMQALKSKIYSQQLFQWDQKRSAWKRGETAWTEYLQLFSSHSIEQNHYPTLFRYLQLQRQNDSIDFTKVRVEKEKAVHLLNRKISQLELRNLNSLNSSRSIEAESQFVTELFSILERYPEMNEKLAVTELKKYQHLLDAIGSIPARLLTKDLDLAEREMWGALAADNPDAVKLLALDRQLEMLSRLFHLEMTPELFQVFSKNEIDFGLIEKEWNELALKCNEENVTSQILDIKKSIPPAMQFYTSAIKREAALIRNASLKLDKMPDDAAVLITGGFHTDVLAQELHLKGYSVVELTPNFQAGSQEKDQQKYFNILKSRSSQLLAQ